MEEPLLHVIEQRIYMVISEGIHVETLTLIENVIPSPLLWDGAGPELREKLNAGSDPLDGDYFRQP